MNCLGLPTRSCNHLDDYLEGVNDEDGCPTYYYIGWTAVQPKLHF